MTDAIKKEETLEELCARMGHVVLDGIGFDPAMSLEEAKATGNNGLVETVVKFRRCVRAGYVLHMGKMFPPSITEREAKKQAEDGNDPKLLAAVQDYLARVAADKAAAELAAKAAEDRAAAQAAADAAPAITDPQA